MIERRKRRGRWEFDDKGELKTRPLATDSADELIQCKCGKRGCWVARSQPFRDHIAELYRLVRRAEAEGLLSHHWNAVLYPLHMAASIDDVEADTGYVDDSGAIQWCRPAYEYEVIHSDIASRYVAASSVFSFVWNAYEAAARLVAPDEFRGLLRQKSFGQRARSLIEARPEWFPIFNGLMAWTTLAERLCERGGLMDERLARARERYPTNNPIFAAELVREFRNHVHHGEDAPPEPDDPHERPRIFRFYAVSRVTLLLLQFLTRISLEGAPEIEVSYDHEEGVGVYGRPDEVLTRLHFRAST